jgi:glutaconate CoA-transferase subunit B
MPGLSEKVKGQNDPRTGNEMTEIDFTPDEMMVVCMSRQVEDGEVVVQGLATPLVAAAYLLARLTHAPNLYFASAIGQAICKQPAPLSLLHIESLWLDRGITNVSFISVAADILPRLRPKEFFRPAQLDKHGNFNNIAFGKDFHRPRLRLPGTGGIPDVTIFIENIQLYVPRHSRVTFVGELDFISGLGFHPRRKLGSGPRCLVTDLGQFDFAPQQCENGNLEYCMRLVSYHPGVSIEQIQARTGFQLLISEMVSETLAPTEEELRLLREEIDPLEIRRLERMSGTERRSLLQNIILQEKKDTVVYSS